MVEGTQVGAYRIVQRIGAGGMGEVWLGEHAMLGRRAAIKVLHAEYSSRNDVVTRFFNEARAATAIADPGIVQIFDFGIHGDGSAYIVMELLDGETLDKRLRQRGVLAVPEALRIMRQVATSLGAAHSRGIVHRDLKPENIYIVRDPEIAGGERTKILDFGIAKLVGDSSVKTNTSAVMGTPTFMSPEQCRGAGHVDQRSDVYSLGCVLFLLLTGHPPYDAEGIGEIIAMHLREPAPVPSHRASWIPAQVDNLVLRCLDKDPARRFASGSELAAAIEVLITTDPGVAAPRPTPVPGPPAAPVLVQNTTLSTAAGSATLPRERSRGTLVVAGGVGALAVGGLITWAVTRNAASEAPVAAAPVPVVVEPAHPVDAAVPDTATPEAVVAERIKAALTSFVAWSRDHAGAPCPDATTLGAAPDPWGQPLEITCTDQPADQRIGAISAGPDGQLHTRDDIVSWRLDREVTSLVDGDRWVPGVKPVEKPVRPRPQPSAPKPKPASAQPPPAAPAPSPPPEPPKPTSAPVVGSDGLIRTR